jgi:hypothetical protein
VGLSVNGDVPVVFRTDNVVPSPPFSLDFGETIKKFQYRAQLLLGFTNQAPVTWAPVGPPALVNTNGTWNGGTPNLAGINPGQVVLLSVMVYPAVGGPPNPSTIFAVGPNSTLVGRCDAFAYAYDPNLPNGAVMTNYPGIRVTQYCRIQPPPPPANVTCNENGMIPIDPGETINGGDLGVSLLDHGAPYSPAGLLKGTIQIQDPRGNASAVYTPNPNTYGPDIIYQYRNGGLCDGFLDEATMINVTILPSPDRPRLVPTHEPTGFGLKLRGLAGHTYSIQKAETLGPWTNVRSVPGNYSEIDLSDLLRSRGRTGFVRALSD